MTKKGAFIELLQLNANLARMFDTDNVEVVVEMYETAKKQIEIIYEYLYTTLNNK